MNKLENKLDDIFRRNHITSFGILIADNIAATYRCLGNNHDRKLSELYYEAEDSYILNEEEALYLWALIDKHLKDKYNLELVSKDMKSKVEVKEIK